MKRPPQNNAPTHVLGADGYVSLPEVTKHVPVMCFSCVEISRIGIKRAKVETMQLKPITPHSLLIRKDVNMYPV